MACRGYRFAVPLNSSSRSQTVNSTSQRPTRKFWAEKIHHNNSFMSSKLTSSSKAGQAVVKVTLISSHKYHKVAWKWRNKRKRRSRSQSLATRTNLQLWTGQSIHSRNFSWCQNLQQTIFCKSLHLQLHNNLCFNNPCFNRKSKTLQ